MTNKWLELKEKMTTKELCIHIMKTYLEYGSLEKLEKIYGVTKPVLARLINKNKEELSKEEPELVEAYEHVKSETRRVSQATKKRRDEQMKPRFNDKVLEQIPKIIKYKDFLNFVLNYETGVLSGKKLVEIAASHGIKVVG